MNDGPRDARGELGVPSDPGRDGALGAAWRPARMCVADRLCDALCLGFAGWTVLCHVTVLAGGSLDTLLWTALAGSVILASTLFIVRARGWRDRKPVHEAPSGTRHAGEQAGEASSNARSEDGPTAEDHDSPAHAAGGRSSVSVRSGRIFDLSLAAALLLASALWFVGPGLAAAWWASVAGLGLAYLRSVRAADAGPVPIQVRGTWLVWVLVAVGIVATLVAVRPDLDDSLYLNLAVGAADAPDRPLLGWDSLHGIPGAPLVLSVYRVHSLEILSAALARTTGIPAIDWSHLVLAATASVMVVLAHARLLRILAPERWLAVLTVVVLIFLVVGETHRWYSNFAFVRLQQGKAIFLSAWVPLTIAYALEFVREPGPARWIRLAAAQIASIGLTATALWVAPVVAVLALACGFRWTRQSARVAALGALASIYPLAVGLSLRARTESEILSLPPGSGGAGSLQGVARIVLGGGALAVCSAAAVVVAWVFSRPGRARRFALVFPLGFLVLLFNPYLAKLIGERLTGDSTYWRVFWVLPIPVLLGLVLTAPLSVRTALWPRTAAWTATAAFVGAFLIFVPRLPVLGAANGTRIAPFHRKVPEEYSVAEALARHVRPGASVVAPVEIAAWLPTIHDHPYPLVTRPYYLSLLHLAEEDMRRRRAMTAMVSGREGIPQDLEEFLRDLALYRIEGVCLRAEIPGREQVETALRDAGFEESVSVDPFHIWTRALPLEEPDHP